MYLHNFKKLRIKLNILFFLMVSISSSAQKDTLKYIFLGHTYEYHIAPNRLDPRIYRLDYNDFDGVWLGGDVCSESLMEYSTLERIDSVFHLTKKNTHWTYGNHDARNGNWIWVEELTGHKSYYTTNYKGITYIVLNTNLTPFDCEQLDDQFRMISNVCDTIQKSSHLIMIMHHGVWHDVPELPSVVSYAQSNARYYNFNCYKEQSTYLNTIYPRLVEVQKRGVDVISLIGDMGAKTLEVYSTDSLLYMGTGLRRSYFTDPVVRNNSPKDYALVFKHVPETGWLEWKFVDFDEYTGYSAGP